MVLLLLFMFVDTVGKIKEEVQLMFQDHSFGLGVNKNTLKGD